MSACLSFDFPGWRADVQPLQDGSPGPDTGTTRALTDLLDELDDLEPDCEDGTSRQKLTQQQQQAQQQPSSEATSTADVDEQKLAQGPTYRTAGGACLQDVPDEVLNIIMAHLDARSLTSLALTSSQLITRVMASSSTADAWRRSATQHALAPITAAVQSLLNQGPCPELCSCSQGSQARSILSLKHSRQELREQHVYLNAKYMQLLKALLALWRPPPELNQQDGAAGGVGGGGSNSMRSTDPCSRNSGSGCSGYEQSEPSNPGGPQAATAAAGTAAGEEEGAQAAAAAVPTTAAVEAAAPALQQNGPGQVLYTASKGIVAGGPLQLQPIKRSECMDPGVLIAQLLKYDWNVAFDCVLLAFDLAADVIAAELAHQEQQRQQQRQGPCQLLPLLLHQFSGFRAFVRAVNARCPRLKDMISAEREAEVMARGAPSTPTLFASGMAAFRSQVLLRYGLRSRLQACLSRGSHLHAPLPSEDGQGSSCELADLALAMLKDVDVADDLTKPERLHTQDALRERFGYKDRLRTFVLPLKT